MVGGKGAKGEGGRGRRRALLRRSFEGAREGAEETGWVVSSFLNQRRKVLQELDEV